MGRVFVTSLFAVLLSVQILRGSDRPLIVQPQIYSGVPDPEFTINDTLVQRAVEHRISRYIHHYKRSDADPEQCFFPSESAYRGLRLGNNVQVCDGLVEIYSSALLHNCMEDPYGEMERMVARAMVREYPETKDLIPDTLLSDAELRGILSVPVYFDQCTLNIDFSRLDTPHTQIIEGIGCNNHLNFPDIRLVHLPHISSTPYMFSVTDALFSNESHTGIYPEELRYVDSHSDFDLDSLSTLVNAERDPIFSNYRFITLEAAVAYLYPVGVRLGGIDRVYFFFKYSTKVEHGHSASISPRVLKNQNNNIRQSERMVYDLKGRLFTRGSPEKLNNEIRANGVYILKEAHQNRIRLNLKNHSGIWGGAAAEELQY